MSLMAATHQQVHSAVVMPPTKHPDGRNAPEAVRARQLVAAMAEIVGSDVSADFARWLSIDPRRWNNFEVGYPISRDMAGLLIKKIPGLSYDWLFNGDPSNLSVEMARKLGELPPYQTPPSAPTRKARSRRAR